MKRQEAVALLKEIVEACKTISLQHISLKASSQEATVESEGFELHIKDHFNEEDWKCLETIIKKRNLSMKKHRDFIVIYK